MKKIIIPFMLAFTSSMANAEYLIKIPLELDLRGHLPNNSIVFVGSTEVAPETPVEETPVEETPAKHEPVDCITKPTDNPQLCEESLTGWVQFADAQNPRLPKDWNKLEWGWGTNGLNYRLKYIPTEPYPTTTGEFISFTGNQLKNVDGLINLTNVNHLSLNHNELTNVNGLSNLTHSGLGLALQHNKLKNVDGLRNLTSASQLNLEYNELTNVNGLSNLKSVSRLYLHENPLTNVDGLANLEVKHLVAVDIRYSGKKLPANSIFCTKNPSARFYSPTYTYAQKSQVCESQ